MIISFVKPLSRRPTPRQIPPPTMNKTSQGRFLKSLEESKPNPKVKISGIRLTVPRENPWVLVVNHPKTVIKNKPTTTQ